MAGFAPSVPMLTEWMIACIYDPSIFTEANYKSFVKPPVQKSERRQTLPCIVWDHIPKETKAYLNIMERVSKQEIMIDVNSEGWKISVFSSDGEGGIIDVHIPAQNDTPIRIATQEPATVERS